MNGNGPAPDGSAGGAAACGAHGRICAVATVRTLGAVGTRQHNRSIWTHRLVVSGAVRPSGGRPPAGAVRPGSGRRVTGRVAVAGPAC